MISASDGDCAPPPIAPSPDPVYPVVLVAGGRIVLVFAIKLVIRTRRSVEGREGEGGRRLIGDLSPVLSSLICCYYNGQIDLSLASFAFQFAPFLGPPDRPPTEEDQCLNRRIIRSFLN